MGNEQSQGANKDGLNAFCCNSNLCNNDSNIDNRMNEIGRKNAYRNVQTGQMRDSWNGSMVDPVKNNGGLPPFQNDKNFNESIKRHSD